MPAVQEGRSGKTTLRSLIPTAARQPYNGLRVFVRRPFFEVPSRVFLDLTFNGKKLECLGF
jgi:hypothetical protein